MIPRRRSGSGRPMLGLLLMALALMVAPVVRAQEGEAPAEEPELPPLVKEPQLLNFVQAPYPADALEAGVEGEVGLLIEIDEAGVVTSVEVIRPLQPALDAAAVEATRAFRFSPAEDEIGPVPVAVEFTYGFVLDATNREGAQPDEQAPVVEAPVNFEGNLLEMGTRRPLPEIPVHVEGPDGFQADTTTDAEGRWSFRGVPIGPVEISASHPEYAKEERSVEITEGEVTELRLWIRNLSYRDDEVVVLYRKESADLTRRTLSMEEVRRVPGTFGDPVRVIQTLPGAARSPFGTGLLIIRGSNPEDSAVYVDGIRIPIIYHLGGYSSVINPDLISDVDYLPGGYGVRYGRSLGGVVDVTTTDMRDLPPDAPDTHITWSTDLLDSGGMVRTKLGKKKGWGVAVAARRSYIDLVLNEVLPLFTDTGLTVKPRWFDYQVKADRLSEGKDKLSLFAFGFEDKLVASTPPGFAQGTDPSTQGDLGTTYATHRIYLEVDHALSDTLHLRAVPSFGVDYGQFSVGSALRLDQTQYVTEIRTELPWTPSPAVKLVPGLDLIGLYWDFKATLPIDPSAFSDYDPLDEREPVTLGGKGVGFAPDVYLDLQLRPLADPERLLINPGIRVSFIQAYRTQSPGDAPMLRATGVDPRISARFKVSDSGSLKGGVGIYTQSPQPFEAWRPSGVIDIGMERAWAAEIGWEQQLSQAISSDISLFGKYVDHAIVANPDFSGLDGQYFTNEGIGRIYGLEFILRHARVKRFFGWVSYTLSRSERNDYPNREANPDDVVFPGSPEPGRWYLFELDQTHILVAVAGLALPRDFEVSAKVQYVTGNPSTPYSGGVYDVDQDYYVPYSTAPYDSERLPAYFEVDARVDRLFTFKRWQLELYLDLLNLVRGKNPEFEIYNYDYTQSAYIRGLPFLPSPGFEAKIDL